MGLEHITILRILSQCKLLNSLCHHADYPTNYNRQDILYIPFVEIFDTILLTQHLMSTDSLQSGRAKGTLHSVVTAPS